MQTVLNYIDLHIFNGSVRLYQSAVRMGVYGDDINAASKSYIQKLKIK
jgi:hypothetical protein